MAARRRKRRRREIFLASAGGGGGGGGGGLGGGAAAGDFFGVGGSARRWRGRGAGRGGGGRKVGIHLRKIGCGWRHVEEERFIGDTAGGVAGFGMDRNYRGGCLWRLR